MSIVTILVAAAALEPGRYVVVEWLSATHGKGSEHTRGLAELWLAGKREGSYSWRACGLENELDRELKRAGSARAEHARLARGRPQHRVHAEVVQAPRVL